MDTEQRAGSCPAPGQTAVRTWLSSSTRGAPRTPSDTTSRFHGDGVRYKAKLIGMDPVADAQGDKMCRDSMMKLKGFEAAARSQGKHKQRVWLKISLNGLKIVDERTAAVIYDHDRSRISSLQKDEFDPRALAYIYQYQDTYVLFYIRTANLAGPVLADIMEVCQVVDQETPQEAAEANSSLPQNDSSASPAEAPALQDVFSPRPDSSTGPSNQASSHNELMEVFSIQFEEPLVSNQSSCSSQPESPQTTLSSSQILSMFPMQPVGGSPCSSPPYSPTTVTWGQQVPLANQWAGPAVAPWPTMPGSMATWASAGTVAPTAGGQIQAYSSPPGVTRGGSTPASPTAVNGGLISLDSLCAPAGATGPQRPQHWTISSSDGLL